MDDESSTLSDDALRELITELSVHIPCGVIRAPVNSRLWQSCRHEDRPARWDGLDVSRLFDLCVVCFRATAGGTSRWSWLACENCRAINDGIREVWGFRPLPLGRHSLMNGIGIRTGSAAEIQRLADFAGGDWRLRG